MLSHICRETWSSTVNWLLAMSASLHFGDVFLANGTHDHIVAGVRLQNAQDCVSRMIVVVLQIEKRAGGDVVEQSGFWFDNKQVSTHD